MKEETKKEQKTIKYFKETNAITLIALVITIIVLLILAAVSISTLTGENGILTRANEAKENTEQAEEDELRKLTQAEASTYLEEHEYTDVSGKKVTIPAKCAVSQVEGENTLEDGLVIIDANGNEWVWIEVPRTTAVYSTMTLSNITEENITDEECDAIYKDLAEYSKNYAQEGFEDTFNSTVQNNFESTEEYNELKNNMLRSVYRNEGFWIGRYEVGDADATAKNITRTEITGISNRAVIKENQIPYNFVPCTEAQEVSNRLSVGEKTSSLMFGIQWNLVCKFLETKGGLSQEEIKGGNGVGSTNWGNYNNSSITVSQGKYNTDPKNADTKWLDIKQNTKNGTMLLTTGSSENTEKMNIYDFAGNLREWTLEYTGNKPLPYAASGGHYNVDGSNYPASNRGSYSKTNGYSSIGFRTSLF